MPGFADPTFPTLVFAYHGMHPKGTKGVPMFSLQHIIWLVICAIGIFFVSRWMLSKHIPLEKLLNVACVLAVISELIKIFANIQMVPSADGTAMHMFMEWRHLPFHLCSIQIFLVFYVRFAESQRNREAILAFMYPTCIIGAFFALLLPSIFTNGITPQQAFTHPVGYQFFIYHSMLIILGIYIATSGQVDIRWKHLRSTLAIMLALSLGAIYLNSAFAYPVYEGTHLLSVENTPNFFFTYRTPVGIALTELWQWYAYLAIIAVLMVGVITLFYLPFRKKK